MARHCLFAFFIIASLLTTPVSISQMLWYPADTLTQGDYDCYHPSVVHNDFMILTSNDFIKVVFERHTSTTSDIVARYCYADQMMWDPADHVISSTSVDSTQTNPDIGEFHFGFQYALVYSVVAWQRWDGNHWQIWYSTMQYNPLSAAPFPPQWTSPRPLTSGDADNIDVRVRHFNDTTIILAWRQDSAVVAARITPSALSPAETLGVTHTTDFDIDATNAWNEFVVLWTDGQQRAFTRTAVVSPDTGWSAIDTQDVKMDVDAPCLMVAVVDPRSFLFDAIAGNHQAVYMSVPGGSPDLMAADSNAELTHPAAFGIPVIFNSMLPKRNSILPYDLIVFERTTQNDSSLVFVGGYGRSADTVRSAGHNRDAVISSQITHAVGSTQLKPIMLTVWESNRSGHSHIYARLAHEIIEDVRSESQSPASFALYQNYPNPFNPSTTIQYTLAGVRRQASGVSEVRIVIYDVLGREVATLVDAPRAPGTYELRFDGSRLASGVYFCHMTAGSFTQVRRMILAK